MTATASAMASADLQLPPDMPYAQPSASDPSTSLVTAYKQHHLSDRLSLAPVIRITSAVLASSLAGLLLGSSHGSQIAGLRFRAENAHRLPKSQKGWYFYHKTKNYHMALGGIKEGLRMAARTGFWVGLFAGTEDAVDVMRDTLAGGTVGEIPKGWRALVGSKDLGSTVIAGLGTAGVFTLWNKFTMAEAARTARLGLVIGFGYGAVQDVVSVIRGRRVGYVDFLRAVPQRWWGRTQATTT